MKVFLPVLLVSFVASAAAAQNPPKRLPPRNGRITLPPIQKATSKKQAPTRVRNDARSFYRDVIDLRRSKTLTAVAEERLLSSLRTNYDDPASMAVDLAGTSKSDLVFGLMKVVDRYGRSIHADKLHFLVLTRPLGTVTSRVVRTVVNKAGGDRARAILFEYLASKYAPVRASSVRLIVDYLTTEDVPQLLRLSRERKPDVRRKTLEVLAQIDDDRARKRILELLTLDSGLGADACLAAVAQGEKIAAELLHILSRPARGRSYGYAAFALHRIERRAGKKLITKEHVPALVRQLKGEDAFLRATCAIVLGAHAYRSAEWKDRAGEDRLIIDGLIDLVAPEAFITGLRMLQPAAREVLVRFSGRNLTGGASAWRGWWAESRPGFVGLRRSLPITKDNAVRLALNWQTDAHNLWFRGPDASASGQPEGADAYVLSATQMTAMVAELKSLGFMQDKELPKLPDAWRLEMHVDGGRAVMLVEKSRGQAIHRAIADVAQAEMWQQYRNPETQPDATAFWRVERKWLNENPGRESERLVHHIVRRLPTLKDPAVRRKALVDLQSVPGLPKLIKESDATQLVAVAKSLEQLDTADFLLLEIALLAGGDIIWRKVISVLEGRLQGAGTELATQVFRVLGPERVALTAQHKDPAIAVAAMHDIAAKRTKTAIPSVVTRMFDRHPDVQRAAIYTLGVLKAKDSLEDLVQLVKTAKGELRRDIWAALGRIGGPQVPAILQSAMESPDRNDKLKAISAMGHTTSVELARFLAARYATRAGVLDSFAQRSELALRQMGPILAVPALRPHLQMQEGPARTRLILLLGELQDERAVRDLIDLLRDRKLESSAARFLSDITGVDLRNVQDRARLMLAWYTDNRVKSPAQWYLAALRGARIPTSLEIQHLTRGGGVGAVEELARLLIAMKHSHMRVMTATMLRYTTGKDFTRGVRHADPTGVQTIADRYRVHAAMVQAARK